MGDQGASELGEARVSERFRRADDGRVARPEPSGEHRGREDRRLSPQLEESGGDAPLGGSNPVTAFSDPLCEGVSSCCYEVGHHGSIRYDKMAACHLA